jgi:hypothetical protein
MMPEVYVPKIKEVQVARDGSHVVLVQNRQRIFSLPWDATLMVAKAMMIQARRIEEELKATQIAFDQGLLIRKGIPFGLTSNPRIFQDAVKEALYNPTLRKAMPFGIKSQEAVGAPALIKHKPK